MESGTLIVTVIMLAMIIIPVILIARTGKKKQE
jgi:hypothetical protein